MSARRLVVVLVAMAVAASAACGTTNSRAEDLERLLARLPVRDLQVPGGELLEEHTSAGAPGVNNADPDDDPYVLRTYSYQGDMAEVCDEIVSQLTADYGYTARCRPFEATPDSSVLVGGHRFCAGIKLEIEGQVFGPDFPDSASPNAALRQTVRLRVQARYPSGGTVPPLPDDVRTVPCE